MRVLFLDIDGVLNSTKYYKSEEHKYYYKSVNEGKIEFDFGFEVDSKAVDILNYLIEEINDLNIVISSTWKRYGRFRKAKNHILKRGFKYPDRIIGATPDLDSSKFCRGDEIQMWLENKTKKYQEAVLCGLPICKMDMEKIDSYCIVDDDTDMLESQVNNFVYIDNEVGLTSFDCEKIKQILNKG